ncbi:MAG: hypothetical protein IPO06_05925 [Leptospiraceae bacterium]|nr:hypothetical protein [Leptospiraceae bacterium]
MLLFSKSLFKGLRSARFYLLGWTFLLIGMYYFLSKNFGLSSK